MSRILTRPWTGTKIENQPRDDLRAGWSPRTASDSGAMVLNGYTVLDVFFCLLRLLVGSGIFVLGMAIWRMGHPADDLRREITENRSYLLFLLTGHAFVLNVLSWPVLYLVLQSHVSEWPGVMCIYGVTQIGRHGVGASRYLPVLISTLQVLKPILVFVSGCAGVLYLINRQTQSSGLFPKVLATVLATGFVTVCDAGVEAAWLVGPKRELVPSSGCCIVAFPAHGSEMSFIGTFSDAGRQVLAGGFYLTNSAMAVGLLVASTFQSRTQVRRLIPWLTAGGLFSLLVTWFFFVEIAAPAILGLPFHRCPYDLVSAAPESVLGVTLFLAGVFSTGWAHVAAAVEMDETTPFPHGVVAKMLFLGSFGYSGSTLLVAVELLLS